VHQGNSDTEFDPPKGNRKGTTSLFYQKRTQYISYQTFRREIDGGNYISHPNVLPVTEVSERLFPFCIMSPWMPDGNITQYIQTNPGANRLTLVRAHQLEDRRG
jgi:hypothetical protein